MSSRVKNAGRLRHYGYGSASAYPADCITSVLLGTLSCRHHERGGKPLGRPPDTECCSCPHACGGEPVARRSP
jgi:hypothetical protein